MSLCAYKLYHISFYEILFGADCCFLKFSDSDLHMTALALELCCTLMADKRSSQNIGMAVTDKVLPQALTLIKSSLLQGQALLVLLPYEF